MNIPPARAQSDARAGGFVFERLCGVASRTAAMPQHVAESLRLSGPTPMLFSEAMPPGPL